MKKAATKDEKAHMDKVQALGCIACRVIGYMGTPAEIHHIRDGQGGGQRSSNYEVLPLCPPHHNRPFTHGVALHAGQETWEARFGTERQLLEQVRELIERGEVG